MGCLLLCWVGPERKGAHSSPLGCEGRGLYVSMCGSNCPLLSRTENGGFWPKLLHQ